MNIHDLGPEARAAVLDALPYPDREEVERLVSGPRQATARIEERAPDAAPAPAPASPGEAPPPVVDRRTAAERLADEVASFNKFNRRKFTPKAPEPELTSSEIERFREIVATAEKNLGEAEARATELAEKGGELELEQLLGVKTAKARGAQNLADQVAAGHLIENRRRALAAAKHRLAEAIKEAEAERRDRRIVELQAKWDRIVAASEQIDAALATLNQAAHTYLTETRDLSSYRDLGVFQPTTDMLQSSTRLAFSIANAGDAVRHLLDTPHVPVAKRESFADLARRAAASVRAARTRGQP